LTTEIGILEKDVQDKALLRIKYEGLDKDPELSDPKG
jgi:hypothetical protein